MAPELTKNAMGLKDKLGRGADLMEMDRKAIYCEDIPPARCLMVHYMKGIGYDPGPKCQNLSRELVKSEFDGLCREFGIEPGGTWVLEVNQEGILQFTRPLNDAERAKYLVDPETRLQSAEL